VAMTAYGSGFLHNDQSSGNGKHNGPP